MVIMNMTGWWKSWPKIPLNSISTLSATAWDTEATIKWTDVWDLTVNGVLANEWSSTKLVRKVGSAPSDSSDWTLVVNETVEDTYSSTWYTDTWLTNWTTYYYWAFSVGSNGLESWSNSVNVTPASVQTWWVIDSNCISYLHLRWDLTDEAGNYTWTSWANLTYDTNVANIPVAYMTYDNWYAYTTTNAPAMDSSNSYTISWWVKRPSSTWNSCFLNAWMDSSSTTYITLYSFKDWDNSWKNRFGVSFWGSGAFNTYNYNPWTDWHLWTCTYSPWTQKIYIDWALAGTYPVSLSWTGTPTTNMKIGKSNSPRSDMAYYSDILFDGKERTAQEIADYYNLVKWNYWIS